MVVNYYFSNINDLSTEQKIMILFIQNVAND